jgi:predicted ATPase/class 3 adenylate cyclase
MRVLSEPPTGTLALLFTDIEGSTRLAARLGRAWPEVLAEHHELLRSAIDAEGGYVDGTEGDAFFAFFVDAAAAARAGVRALRALRAHPWPEAVGELRVRMGMHVGYVERNATGYVGLEIHRAARVAAAAHGGQLLLTAAARELIGDVVATEPLGAHRLKDFPSPEQLFCAVVDDRGAAAFPPPRTQELRPTNLPAGGIVLVGREAELRRIQDALLLDGDRLVTLTGRGGAGKTSLALLAGSELLDEHPGGVWLVSLAQVSSPDSVAAVVAAVVGADKELDKSPVEAIRDRLGGRGPTLLIVDNMEHVRPAAWVLTELLAALPNLRCLVTSQAPLRIADERVIVLDALDEPSALALIRRVAGRRGLAVEWDQGDRETVVQVARLLDGLPLALELAAARLALLTPKQLHDRLRGSLDLLSDAAGQRPERQRSLRATVRWTLDLLAPAPRELFVRLGAFAGPVELEELETVTGTDGLDVLESLAALIDVALLRRVESGDGAVRFGLPEALRQIASEMLDQAPDGERWRGAHAQRQRDLVWAARTTIAEWPVYRAALAADAEMSLALRWATDRGDPLAGSLAAAWAQVLGSNGRLREAAAVLELLEQSPPSDAAVRCQALVSSSVVSLALGRREQALASADQALAAAPDSSGRFAALIARGLAHVFSDRRQEGVDDHTEATAIARTLDPSLLAGALLLEAQARMSLGELERAAALLSEGKAIGMPVQASGLRWLDTLEGDLAMARQRPDAALEPYARSLELAEAHNDLLQVMFDLRGLANALAALGRDEDALEVAGLADVHAGELTEAAPGLAEHLQGNDPVRLAEQRVGIDAAAAHKARGQGTSAGYRVTRACELARHR